MFVTVPHCIGIPCFIIYIFTKQSFPWGQIMCLVVHGAVLGTWHFLSIYGYNNE